MLNLILLLACDIESNIPSLDDSNIEFGDESQTDSPFLLAVGDSFFEWNAEEGASIPDVVAESLDFELQNNAISGAYFSAEDGDDIREQYESGEWGWVLVDGGGNDMNDECNCNTCEDNLDSIALEDGTAGDLYEFVSQIRSEGPRVAIMTYYNIPSNADDFRNCNDEVEDLANRFAAVAENMEGVIHIDARDVASPETTPEAYDSDLVHPSVEGCQIIGEYIAEQIRAAD
ncbi:MAG: SGNH/GDSL hydrolase family protein [Myxococcota bacterium]|nr:SGNH/GDSL hydrolase family protein [Myxococcota bacterium]